MRILALGFSMIFAFGCGSATPTKVATAAPSAAVNVEPVATVASGETLPSEVDGTHLLGECPRSLMAADKSRCADLPTAHAATYNFSFRCDRTSIWELVLVSQSPATITAVGKEFFSYVRAAADKADYQRIRFTSHEVAGECKAEVITKVAGAFEIELRQVEPALSAEQCDALCLSEKVNAITRGCECGATCHNACTPAGSNCGLPCNSDSPGYDCPFDEDDIADRHDCELYPSDNGQFEHRGNCYRCGDGQQCCYTERRDNGTGSYDLCPPLDPGPDDRDPNGCSGVLDHCACDVIPLCGCMAQNGQMNLCAKCVGDATTDVLSCNASGDDSSFCSRAYAAYRGGFDWCKRVGDVKRCFDRPPNW